MKSWLSKKNKRRITIIASVAGVIALLLVLLPIGLRWGAAKWLSDQGVATQIEDIDLNLFTGTMAITNAHGKTEQGQGFSIEHALVNLRYWPLFSKQIYLSDLELNNARIDIQIGEDDQLRVAGLPIGGGEPEPPPEEPGTPWGFGLDRAAIGKVTVHYQQPDFEREVTLSSSSTSDLATWEPNEPFPVDADLSIGDSTIKLQGQVRPFGNQIIGDLKLGINNFALDLVAPLAKQAGVEQLVGVLKADLQLKLNYRAEHGLDLGIDGSTGLQGATIRMPDLNLNNADINWQGKIQTQLLSQQDNTDQVNTDGHLSIAKLDVALPQTLAFSQHNADWQGTLDAKLGEPITVLADGALKLKQTHLDLFAASPAAAAKADAAPPADTQAPARTSAQPDAATISEPTQTSPETAVETPASQDTESAPEPDTAAQEAPAPDATAATPAKPIEPEPAPVQSQGPKILTLDQGNAGWKGKINLSLAELGPAVTADGQLSGSDTHLLMPADQTEIKQKSIDWQGHVDMSPGEQGPSVQAKGKLATGGTDLSLPTSGVALRQQALTWDGHVDYAPGEPALVHAGGALQAEGLDLNLAQQAMSIAGGHLGWSGDLALDPAAEAMPANTELPLRLTGNLDGADVTIADTAKSKTLAKLDKFTLADIAITGLNNIRSASVTANGLVALERTQGAPRFKDYPYIAKLQTLSISQLALTNQSRLELAGVDIGGIDALLYRGKDGAVEVSQWFASPGDAGTDKPASTAPAVQQSDTTTAFQVALGRGLIHDSLLTVDDRGVSPAFNTKLSKLRVALADLDGAKPTQGSAMNLSATLGRYGSINADGQIKPFLEPPSATLTGRINAINLAPISGYTVQAIDRRIDQGTFSADLKFNLDRGNIDANAKLKLTKLRIGGAQTETGAVQKKLGLPLNKILSLLRDGDGNITLNLPVGGSLEDPQFSILGIVRKAIFKSLQSAVLVIYAPLGILKAGAGLLNLSTALTPDPILFAPGQSALDDSDKTFLDKTAKLLSDRPKAEMIVCGHAVPSDRTALTLPGPGAAVAEGETAPTAEELATARDDLLELAGKRTSLVGDYLVSKGIAPQRLVFCNPALGEPEKALPRTTLSF